MDGQVPRDIIQYQLLADEPELEFELRRGGLELSVTVDPRRHRAARHRGRRRPVRPGPDLRQPLRVLLHPPAAEGHAPEPVREGRRLPAVVSVRQLHHPDPLHRGRPRTGRDRGPVPAVGEHPRHRPRGPGPACCATGGARPACAGCGPCSTTASRSTARSWSAPGSTTAPSSTTPWPGCSTATRSWPRVACVPLGVSRYNAEAAMRPAHRGRGRPPSWTWSRAGRRPSSTCSGRRLVFAADEYYLARRPSLSPPRDLREPGPARERRRHGPAPSRPACRATVDEGIGVESGLLPVRRRRPGRRLPGAPGHGSTLRPRRRRPRRRGHRRVRRPDPRPAGRRAPPRRPGRRRPQRLLRRQHRRRRAA